MNFESMGHALLWASTEFPDGASVEEMHWLLCLSTVGGAKRITRRSISRELSRRTDLFVHTGRARYVLVKGAEAPQVPVERPPVPEPVGHMFPSLVWGEQGGLQLEMAPMHIMHAGPCSVRDDEEEFNPFAFFGGSFEFAHP
jgi:hypothetical protein